MMRFVNILPVMATIASRSSELIISLTYHIVGLILAHVVLDYGYPRTTRKATDAKDRIGMCCYSNLLFC